MADPRLIAGWARVFRAIIPPERIQREKRVDLVITHDGRARADRLYGQLQTENATSFDSSSITTGEMSSVSAASSLPDYLQDISDSIVAASVNPVDTASIDMHASPGSPGTNISADVIYGGTGSAATAARSDHNHTATYQPIALTATATLDFPSIAAQTCAELTITVTGAAVGSAVSVGPPAALEAGLSATGYVSATSTVTVRLCNVTTGAIDPAAATWRATAL